MAAAKVEIIRYTRTVGIGDTRVYKVTLSDGATSFDLGSADTGVSDASWELVYSCPWVAANSNSGTPEVYFDGTSVKGAGFTANETVYVTVTGKHG